MIDKKDNVVVVTEAVKAGTMLQYDADGEVRTLTAATDIPVYHKAACEEIPEGALVIKYGHVIGKATRKIEKGEHVHCHNVVSAEENRTAEV